MSTPARIRLRFAKHGPARLISHHDLLRAVERLIRRSELPIVHTQGFNPRPKLSFALALGLGIEGRREIVDFEFARPLDPDELVQRLNAFSPAGLTWLDAELLPAGCQPPEVVAARYLLPLDEPAAELAQAALARFLAAPDWPHRRRRPGHERILDLRSAVLEAAIERQTLRFTLEVAREGCARPEEFLEALGLDFWTRQGAVLIREDLVLRSAHPAPGRRQQTRDSGSGSPDSFAPSTAAPPDAGLALVEPPRSIHHSPSFARERTQLAWEGTSPA